MIETENTDIKTDRISKITEYYDLNEISAVVFAIRETLTDDEQTILDRVTSVGNKFKTDFTITANISEGIGEIINYKANEILLERDRNLRDRPTNIYRLTLQALKNYAKNNDIEHLYKRRIRSIRKVVEEHLKLYYLQSPYVFDDSPKIIDTILRTGREVLIYGIGSQYWTERRVARIEALYHQYEGRTKERILIPFYTTEGNCCKDIYGWRMAQRNLNFNFINSQIIGENYYTEILPAYELGCRNLVHINKRLENVSKDIITVQNIGQIFDHIN